jgi:plastocyanin
LNAWLEHWRQMVANGDVQGLINQYGEFATLDLGFEYDDICGRQYNLSVAKGPGCISEFLRRYWNGVIERLVTINDVTIGGENNRGSIRIQYTQETYTLQGCGLSENVEQFELERQPDGNWLITSDKREFQNVEQTCSREREEQQNKIKLIDVAYAPPFLTLHAGQAETVVLINVGALPHNFSIDALDVSVDVAPGEVMEVVITADAGEYEFSCNQPGHREAGMTGTLTVQ